MRHFALVAVATSGIAASASATVVGNQVFGDAYLVVDGARTLSVLDLYVKSNDAADAFSSVFGVANYKASWTATADFVHAGNSSWNPNYTGAAGAAWDSFVTAGMRTQIADEYGATPIALTADPGFSNFSVADAKKVVGPATGNGPGWFPAAGANPATNPYAAFGFYNGLTTEVNTAKNTDGANGIAAGSSLDNMSMIGRFTIDITADDTAVNTMAVKFAMAVRSNGSIASGATNPNFRVDQVLTFAAVPAPGAIALLGLASLGARRRVA
jgi:hypothetical protein